MDTWSQPNPPQWRSWAHIKLLKLIYQNIWMWSRLISSQEMVLPAVVFATFQIKTTVPVKPSDLSGHDFNSKWLCAGWCANAHEKGSPGQVFKQ